MSNEITMKSAFWARKAHKWIGLIIGVQALLWMISGVYMTVISLDIIHGDHLAHAHQQPLVAPTHLSGEELQRRYPGMTQVKLKRLLERDVYEIHARDQVYLLDATTGEVLSPGDQQMAIALAKDVYQGQAPVARVEWVTQAPQEVATRPVPMWAVHYADAGETTLYFSPYSGELLARRHSLWRWFDFLWMFHIMDYEARSDVNNTLLRVASAIGLVFVLSGAWLLFYSFRRRAAA